MQDDWIGYRWLAQHYDISPVHPFRTVSSIGKVRDAAAESACVHQRFAAVARPADTLAGHLAFALKHEGVHLEFLKRLLDDPAREAALLAWVEAEPTGQYARRAGFFHEFLTGRRLPVQAAIGGNYVDALDAGRYFTAAQPLNVPHWRVRDNLPGNRAFCPLVHRTQEVREAEQYDCAMRLAELATEFGADVVHRCAAHLSLRESAGHLTARGGIAGPVAATSPQTATTTTDARMLRWACVMERQCGQGATPLAEDTLESLQCEILGPHALCAGLRRQPAMLGERAGADGPAVLRYVAPHPLAVPSLLAGLRRTDERTAGRAELVRAAVLSFGFLYIRPLSDGNGRMAGYLINDTLRRDGGLPDGLVLPLSAALRGTAEACRQHDAALELFSRPLMAKYAGGWGVGAGPADAATPDDAGGAPSLDAYEDAMPAWRYPDLTGQVEYLARVIRCMVARDLRELSEGLHDTLQARRRVKAVVEAPDTDVDRLIDAVRGNGGKLPPPLAQAYPLLADDALVAALEAAVRGP